MFFFQTFSFCIYFQTMFYECKTTCTICKTEVHRATVRRPRSLHPQSCMHWVPWKKKYLLRLAASLPAFWIYLKLVYLFLVLHKLFITCKYFFYLYNGKSKFTNKSLNSLETDLIFIAFGLYEEYISNA